MNEQIQELTQLLVKDIRSIPNSGTSMIFCYNTNAAYLGVATQGQPEPLPGCRVPYNAKDSKGNKMNYYPFHIGDYKSHTSHLDPLEDIAYRRMLDWHYLHEKGLPESEEEIGRLINMRTHCDCIANVLREFFTFDKQSKTWVNNRVNKELSKYNEKSVKAKQSAQARWNKTSSDANALRKECERNATKTNNQNHKPKSRKAVAFSPPTLQDVISYASDRNQTTQLAKKFYDYFDTGQWIDSSGKKVKNWKQKFITWENKNETHSRTNGYQTDILGSNDLDW